MASTAISLIPPDASFKLGGSQFYPTAVSVNTFVSMIAALDASTSTSSFKVNGSTTSGSSAAGTGNGVLFFLSDQFGQSLIGSALEGGVSAIQFNSTQITNLNANMGSRGGY
jgi:hypothetical protein